MLLIFTVLHHHLFPMWLSALTNLIYKPHHNELTSSLSSDKNTLRGYWVCCTLGILENTIRYTHQLPFLCGIKLRVTSRRRRITKSVKCLRTSLFSMQAHGNTRPGNQPLLQPQIHQIFLTALLTPLSLSAPHLQHNYLHHAIIHT